MRYCIYCMLDSGTKVLYDCGLVPTKEPFQQLFNQGMILAYSYRDALGKYHHPSEVEQRGDQYFVMGTDTEVFSKVEKMSKSKRNTVDPLEIVADFGADTLRGCMNSSWDHLNKLNHGRRLVVKGSVTF